MAAAPDVVDARLEDRQYVTHNDGATHGAAPVVDDARTAVRCGD